MAILPKINLVKRTFQYIKPHKTSIICLFIVSIFSVVLALLPTYYIGKIIDYTINNDFQQILQKIILLFIIFVITSIFSFIETYLNNIIKNKVVYSIKNSLFSHIIKLPITIFDQFRVGDFVSRIEGDANIVAKFFIEDVLNLILSLTTLVVTGFFIFRLSYSLSFIALLTFPINFILYYFFGRIIKKHSLEGKKINDNYLSFLQESLNSIREIKCLNIMDKLNNKYFSFSGQFIKNNMKITMAQTFSGLSSMSVSSVSEWIVIAYGCWQIIQGKLTIGSYVAFNGYLGKFLNAIKNVLSINMTFQILSVSLERIYELLDIVPENENKYGSELITNGNITINSLTFRYDNTNYNVLNGILMDFPSESLTAIVGYSGCGKSTSFNLLIRLYESESGSIKIDGHPIQNIDLSNLRNNIAYIQQESLLFNTSVKENLLLVRPEATMEQIIDACKLANIDQFIQTLPQRYDTIIGEGGIKLSGGQKQMLSIARAILKNSKVFLLDEITSDLDGQSEFYIMECIHKLSKKHTVIMIAHRLSSIIDFPRIIVMNDGVVEDEGTHRELITRCNTYKELFLKTQHAILKNV